MTRRAWTCCAVVLGIVVAVVATSPLPLHVWNSIPLPEDQDGWRAGDYLLCVWILGFGGRQLFTDPLHLFEGNILHPFRHSLAYSESMLSAGALVAPLNALSGNPVFGYNVYFLATYALSVLGMFLLVREITEDPRAGLLAGMLFGLAAERFLFAGFLPALAIQWAPFVMYAWVRSLTAFSRARGAGLALALIAHMHAGAYPGLMFCALLFPWALVLLASGPWPLRRWLAVSGVVVPALAVGFAVYLPYLYVRQELQYSPPVGGFAWWGQYWLPLVDPMTYLRVRLFDLPSSFLVSPLPVYLVAIFLIVRLFSRRSRAAAPRGELAHLAAAAVLLAGAVSVSLGSDIRVFGTMVHGPLYYLRQLPGFSSMRAVVRFMLLATVPSSLVAGIAMAGILRPVRRPAVATAICLGLAAVVLVDNRTFREEMPLRRIETPADQAPVYRWLTTTPADTAVVELPYGRWRDESLYLLRALYHRRRIMNGYSAVMPRVTEALYTVPDPLGIQLLQDAGIRYVIAHTDLMNVFDRGMLTRLRVRPDLHPVRYGTAIVFEVPQVPVAPAPPPAGVGLPHDTWRVEASDPGAEAAIDGDLGTHWVAKTDHETFLRIDLGAPTLVTDARLRLGWHPLEFPRSYRLSASLDGTTWQPLGGENPTLPPLASYQRDHRDIVLPLHLQPTTTRYVEIRVPPAGPHDVLFVPGSWGVHEIELYGPAP